MMGVLGMKKMSYVFMAFISFFGFSLIVNAETKCVYEWTEDASLDTSSAMNWLFNLGSSEKDYKAILSTGDNDNRLTEAEIYYRNSDSSNTSYYAEADSVTYANSNGIALNSDGSCPSVVFYHKATGTQQFKIYKTKETCEDGLLTRNGRCSDEIEGVMESSDSSNSNIADSNIQYLLSSQYGSTCYYRTSQSAYYSNIVISITPSGSDDIESSCTWESSGSDDCAVVSTDDDVVSAFYNSGTFSCIEGLYAVQSGGITRVNLSLKDPFGAADEVRESNEELLEELESGIDPSEFGNEMECEDIFDNSFGELLNTLLNYIRIIGPILVVLLSALDFIKAVVSSDEKAMKQAQSKLVIRLVAAICLFLVPTLVQLLLSFINATVCLL